MSAEANKWSKRVNAPSRGAKAVLRELSDYADPEGRAWPLVPTLAEVCQLSERQVVRLLNELEKAKLIEHESYITPPGSVKRRPVYRLAMPDAPPLHRSADLQPRGGAKYRRAEAPGKGDVDVTCEAPKGDMDVTPKGDMDVTHNCVSQLGGSNRPSPGGAGELAFEQVFTAWAKIAPGRVSRPKAEGPWLAAEDEVGPDRLAAAALRYLAGDRDVQRGRAIGLDRWLSERRWEPWLIAGHAAAAAATDAATAFPDCPPDVADQLRSQLGDKAFLSLLGGAKWRASDRTVLTLTKTAADRLTNNLPRALRQQLGIRFEKSAPMPATEEGAR